MDAHRISKISVLQVESAILETLKMQNHKTLAMVSQGRRNVFTTGQAKVDPEDYAIKHVGG